MPASRRDLLAAAALLPTLAAFSASADPAPAPAAAPAADPRMAPRTEGSPTAHATVSEWFSFTCPHCAAFARDVYPEVKAKLIDTGKLRWTFCEFPRDRLDLAAAMVARSLPPSRYEPFALSLLATQQSWAFNRAADPKEELAKMAALAGMPRTAFDKVLQDEALQTAILNAQSEAENTYHIDSTPTFIMNGKPKVGELQFGDFAALTTA